MKKLFLTILIISLTISTVFAKTYFFKELKGIVESTATGPFSESPLEVSLSFAKSNLYIAPGEEGSISYSISGSDKDSVTLSLTSSNETFISTSDLSLNTTNSTITVPSSVTSDKGETTITLIAKDSDDKTIASANFQLKITTLSDENVLTKWTVTAGQTVTFPFNSADQIRTYTGHVDWGDGSAVESFTDKHFSTLSHTYANAGTYNIRIDGDFYSDADFASMFRGKTMPAGFDTGNWTNLPTSYSVVYMFYGSRLPYGFNFSGWDFTGKATSYYTVQIFKNSTISGDIHYDKKMSGESYSNFIQMLAREDSYLPAGGGKKIYIGDNTCPTDDTNCLDSEATVNNKGWILIQNQTISDENVLTKWTVNAGQTVTFPFNSADQIRTYTGHVNWGDGSAVEYFRELHFSKLSHTYANAGTYDIRIDGDFYSDADFASMFRGKTMPAGFDTGNWTNLPTSYSVVYMFYGSRLPYGFNFSGWDFTGKATSYYTVQIFKNSTISGDIHYDKKMSEESYSNFMQMLARTDSYLPSGGGKKIYIGENTCPTDDTACTSAETTITGKGWIITRTTAE